MINSLTALSYGTANALKLLQAAAAASDPTGQGI